MNLRFEHGFPVVGDLKLGAPKKVDGGVVFRAQVVTCLDPDKAQGLRLGDPVSVVADRVVTVTNRKAEDTGVTAIEYTSKLKGLDVMLEVHPVYDGEAVGSPLHVEAEVRFIRVKAGGRVFRHVIVADLRPKAEVAGLLALVGGSVQVRIVASLSPQQELPWGQLTYTPPESGPGGTQLDLDAGADEEEELPPEADGEAEKPKRKRARAAVDPVVLDGDVGEA